MKKITFTIERNELPALDAALSFAGWAHDYTKKAIPPNSYKITLKVTTETTAENYIELGRLLQNLVLSTIQ